MSRNIYETGYGKYEQDWNRKTPVGLIIAKAPNKTAYRSGERFDNRGMVVQLLYPTNEREITTDYDVYPKRALTPDDTFVEIKSRGFVVRQRITVDAKADCNCSGDGNCYDDCCSGFVHRHTYECEHPEYKEDIYNIGISQNPIKMEYFEGELFDPTGIEVSGNYSYRGSIRITAYSIQNVGPLVAGTNMIEVRYKDLTAMLYITAIPRLCAKTVPATESVGLVSGVDGAVYLGTGDFSASFNDVNAGDSSLPLEISHVYRSNGFNFGCGNGWRLNLHCTLRKADEHSAAGLYLTNMNIQDMSEIDYIYTDAAGIRYTFDEVFYYADSNKKKIAVEKSDVQIDLDGRLYYVDENACRRDVIRELKTASGLRLSTRLENVKGIEKIEQRHEDIAKLENEIQQYRDAVAELEYNIYQNESCNKDAPAPSSNITSQVSEASNLYWLGTSSGNRTIERRLNDIQNKINEVSVSDEAPKSTDQYTVTERDKKLWALQKYSAELNKKFNSDTQWRQYSRKSEMLSQYKRQHGEYKRILEQKLHQLELYKHQAPVAYLANDDGQTLCFNEYGKLCGIVDGYENQVIVNWEAIQVGSTEVFAITSVYSGDHRTALEYNSNGLLSSVTDYNGKRVEYKYNANKQLTCVTMPNGKSITFTYNCNYMLASINSEATAELGTLTYADRKLIAINNSGAVARLTDETVPASCRQYSIVSNTKIRYADGVTVIERDNETAKYYLDYNGSLAAKFTERTDGSTAEAASFAYVSENKDWSYKISETGAPVWKDADIEGASAKPFFTLSKDMLPKGVTEFVLCGEGNITADGTLSNTGMRFQTPFIDTKQSGSGKYELRAVVKYGTTSDTFRVPFDYRNNRAQFAALPVRLRKAALDSLDSIDLYFECSLSAVLDSIRFSPAEWEYSEYDEFGATKKQTTSEQLIAPGVYRSTATTYEYADNNKLIAERTTVTTSGKVNETYTAVKKYSYCEHGNLVKTESYVEGDENEKGVSITERVCDEKGHVIKEFSYNSLDSSTKFYTESEVSENGVTTAEIDETGENKTELEYVDGTTTVKAQKLPNGSKFAYGYDTDGNVTAITQSTDDGESNSTEIKYTLGSPTRLTSGNNTVFYEYDKKHRKTKVTANGKETTYDYAGSKYDKTETVTTDEYTVGDVTFPSVKADKVTATFEDVIGETYTDKNGNTVMTKINGEVMSASKYDGENRITENADGVTGSVKKYTYSNDGLKTLNRIDITEGENVDSIIESYFYNDYGKQSGRVIGGAVEQSYAYFYKDNAQKDLERIALPNGINFYPQTDVNGRNTGKKLKDGNNINLYGEYVYYRKVGDHGTNMPSSVYFGKNKNNRYSITDNIKYKYDGSGNISEVRENGILTVKYAYDKIGRIVREDNRKFGKTTLWSYDNCGNILSKRETQYTLKPTDEIEVFTDEKLYFYDGDKLLSFGNEILFYTDGEGKDHINPVIYRGHQLSWDYERQLKSFGENTFAYDGYGRRVRKNNTVFTYDANNKLVKQSDGVNTLEFVYDNNGLSGVMLNGTAYIYGKDVQGNVVCILDKTGREVVQYGYDAWGDNITRVLDETHALIAELNPFRYRTYYYDTETNLYYLNTRYYDPEVGRFISQDDVSYLDPEHINGLNLFAYCGNNPVMGYDPDGTWDWGKFWNVLGCIGLAIVATVVVVGGVIASVASFGAATPLAAFGLTVLGGALIGAGTALMSNMQSQIQNKGWGNVDLVQTLTAGAIGFTIGALTSAISFGIGEIAKGIGQTFGYLLSKTEIGGLLVSKVFSTSLLMNIFGSIGSIIGGVGASFLGDYMGNNIFYSAYTEDNAKETAGSVFLGWLWDFFGHMFY